MTRLVVFDLDGTLIDSRRDLANAANALIVERGGAPQSVDAIAMMVGEGAAVLVSRALTAAGREVRLETDLPRFIELYNERLLDNTSLYDRTAEMLAALSGRATLAVLTNKPLHATRRILDGLAISSFFSAVVGGDSPLGRKPDPAGLQWLMREAGATQAETVLIGDSAIDLRTARAAGTRVCIARYGFGFASVASELTGTEWLVDSAYQIPAAIGF